MPETDTFFDEFTDFVAAAARGAADAPVPVAHARQVIEVLEATERSSESGREVVLAG